MRCREREREKERIEKREGRERDCRCVRVEQRVMGIQDLHPDSSQLLAIDHQSLVPRSESCGHYHMWQDVGLGDFEQQGEGGTHANKRKRRHARGDREKESECV